MDWSLYNHLKFIDCLIHIGQENPGFFTTTQIMLKKVFLSFMAHIVPSEYEQGDNSFFLFYWG